MEEASSFGWIDSKSNTLDEERSLLWMSPRNPRSGWSTLNKTRIARLEEAGLMTDAGRAMVTAAKTSDAWSLLDKVEALEVPEDLRRALAANPKAESFFGPFRRRRRRGS